LDVSTDGGTSWTTLWSLSGDQGNQWTKQIVDISTYAGMTVNFSFVGVLGGSQTSDMAIDDVSIPGTGPTYAWFFKSATSASYTTSTFYYINGTTRFDVQPQIKTDYVARSGTYRVEVTSENGCIATDEVEIVVRNEVNTIDAGTDQFVCGSASIILNGSNSGTGNGLWTQVSGPNTATFADNTLNNTEVSGLVNGAYKFNWEVSGDICNPGADSVIIEVVDAPNLVTNAVFACGAADLTAATVTIGSSNLGNLTYWVDTMATIQLARPDSITTSGVYYIKTLTAEGCEEIKPVTVTISDPPTLAATSSNPTTCGGSDGSITLTLTNVPDGTYTINYMDGVPSAQTFTNVSVTGGSATISGLSTGTYNDLTITTGCTSTEDVDIVLEDNHCVGVGNLVFIDLNNDGSFNGSDIGVDHVEVWLFNAGDDPSVDMPVSKDTTSMGGYYLFDNVNNGQYFLHIPSSAFNSGTPLNNTISSPPEGTDDDQDDNVDENGQNTLVAGGVSSTIIDLQPNMEPTGEADSGAYTGSLEDDDVNLTVDFGFFTCRAAACGTVTIQINN